MYIDIHGGSDVRLSPMNEITIPDPHTQPVIRATRIPVIFADALVLCLTWMKTFRQAVYASKSKVRMPLAGLILRDGTVYFLYEARLL